MTTNWIDFWTRPPSRKAESNIKSGDTRRITVEQIRARLAGTRPPPDPLRVSLPLEVPRWPARLQQKLTSDLKPAGVLIPIIGRGGELSVLLTERAADLKHHASQISFPGGRMEHGDADICATALRETHEEVGIRPSQVEVAGYLDPAPTVTGYAVTPVVGLVRPGFTVVVDRGEVAEAFEVPLSFLMDLDNQHHGVREYEGVTVPIIEFNYRHWRIWGATAGMLIALRSRLIISS